VDDAAAAAALASLVGRSGVIAITQDGAEFHVTVSALEGDRLTVLAPRMRVGGIDTLELRFSVADRTWRATLGFEEAEYHSHEMAAVALRLRSMEPLGSGVRAQRERVHAEGTLRVIEARNVLARNVYTVTVEDVSATGLRFTCDFDVAQGDVFTITIGFEDRPSMHVRATVSSVEQGPFGRRRVRAQIQAPPGRGG
jgi:PilZ domain